MSDDGKVTFLVMATLIGPNRWTRPHFVRAASIADAYVEVLKIGSYQHPTVKLEAYVIDIGMIPNVKEVAERYWKARPKNFDTSFEDYWDEHGIEPEES